jgi:hypothetical protein
MIFMGKWMVSGEDFPLHWFGESLWGLPLQFGIVAVLMQRDRSRRSVVLCEL